MINNNQYKLISLLFLTGLFSGVTTPIQAQTAIVESIKPATGEVRLKREKWSDYHLIGENTSIQVGDLLYPSAGTKVRVICPDKLKSIQPVTQGEPSGLKTICPNWEIRTDRDHPVKAIILGGLENSLPYLISPRNSILLTNKPTFRWNGVKGATKYFVELSNGNQVIWVSQVSNNEVVYDGDRTLETGVFYALRITTDTGASSAQDKGAYVRFIILDSAEAQLLKNEIEDIEQGDFTPIAKSLLLVDYYRNYVLPATNLPKYNLTEKNYRNYSLRNEAIVTLENLVDGGVESPLLYRLLGDLYRESGLANLAIENYQKAIVGANSPQWLEDKSKAQYGLADIYVVLDKNEEAISFYQQAKQGYEKLSNDRLVLFLERQIESLK